MLKSAREDTNHTLSKKAKNESLKRPLKGSAGKILHLGKKEEKTEIRNISGTQKKHKIPTLEPLKKITQSDTAWSNGGPERDVADVEVEGGKSQVKQQKPSAQPSQL